MCPVVKQEYTCLFPQAFCNVTEGVKQVFGGGQPVVKILRQGDTTKPYPFTIAIIANPALETPWNSGTFVVDPITANQPAFDAAADYINDSLFGGLPGQKERLLGDPSIVGTNIRVVSLFVTGLPATEPNSLVAQDGVSNILVARRANFLPFLATQALYADVAYAVSESATHTRASAWYTSDDDTRPGTPFTLDGTTFAHRYWSLIPGTVALHTTGASLTAVHEFGHALSSYTNGSITDLYVDSPDALNNKLGRPIPSPPAPFRVYNGTTIAIDQTRDGLGYLASWLSYHAELNAPSFPAIMDDYWMATTTSSGGVPEDCEHDTITRQFLLDRIRAKMSR